MQVRPRSASSDLAWETPFSQPDRRKLLLMNAGLARAFKSGFYWGEYRFSFSSYNLQRKNI
jgi:hypothetical protein